MTRALFAAAFAAAFAATPALAHTGAGATAGFAAGLLHPVTGLDHVLAMVAVGLLAVTLGGRTRLLVPGAFVVMMVLGAAVGMAAVGLPLVELGIVASVVVLGLAVFASPRLPAIVAVALAGGFAVFHGHAHGTEMPLAASGLAYGAGFVLATAALHAAGFGLGHMLGRAGATLGPRAIRAGGGAIAAAGLVLLAI